MKLAQGGYVATSFHSLPAFDLMQPRSVEEAAEMLAHAANPALLAGGTDLCARFNEGFAPAELIDLSAIQSMRTIEEIAGVLRIGALVTHFEGAKHREVRRLLPGFADAWSRIATIRIRMSATIGGNLMARRTRYEGAILLTALGASMRFASGDGPYQAAVESLWTHDAPKKALLLSVEIPVEETSRFHYARMLRPALTQALCIRHGAGGYTGRLVVATEYLAPVALPVDLARAAGFEDIAAGAARIARETLRALPADFADACVSNEYAREASETILRRQLLTLANREAR
jgi:carbon-monoxide dehydrogenase medium subunit